MKNKIIIDDGLFTTRAAFLKKGILCDFLWESKFSAIQIGDIYKGRVIKMDNAMDACLVDIGLDKPAYLGKMDMVIEGSRLKNEHKMKSAVKTGDTILVQITRLPIDAKGAKISMRLSIAGDYLVYFPNQRHIGFSKQISEDDKKRLCTFCQYNEFKGIIFRTKSVHITESDILSEYLYLKDRWRNISRYKVLGKAPKKIYSAQDNIQKFIQKYWTYQNNDIEIIFNSSKCRDDFCDSLYKNSRQLQYKLDEISILYKDVVPIFEKYRIETLLKEDLSKNIKLKNGGFIVLEETESCVFIDVNSGWHSNKKNLEHTAYLTNIEAAYQIARLLRVRDLSGIILVDFIDMKEPKNQLKLIDEFAKMVISDTNKVTIFGMTKLGMLELTRKKTNPSLLKKVCHIDDNTAFHNKSYSGKAAVEMIIRDIPFYYKNTGNKTMIYGIDNKGFDIVKREKDNIVSYFEQYCTLNGINGFELVFAMSIENNTHRINKLNDEKTIKISVKAL